MSDAPGASAGGQSAPSGGAAWGGTGSGRDLSGRATSGSAASGGAADGTGGEEATRNHWWRLLAIWAVLSVVLDIVYYTFVGPHVPPGRMSNTASDAAVTFNVLFVIGFPVMLGVWVYMAYAVVNWRASRGGPEPVGGVDARSHLGLQMGWILTTTVLVLGLAGYGTYELVQPGGSGGGQGPAPIWTPTSKTVLPIQVIAQQWKFTYRYPTFGGMETTRLVVPQATAIAFHVTSLDVIHDFWAYQLGVKADANPQQDNVAFATPEQLGTFTVRCNELCGIFHGAMYNSGQVLTKDQFMVWARANQIRLAPLTRTLAPFAYTYVPDANGADGGYYPDSADPYSPVETYGAKQKAGA